MTAGTTYEVLAQTDGPGRAWWVVLRTDDRAYAEATVEQFKEADVPVRLETFTPRPKNLSSPKWRMMTRDIHFAWHALHPEKLDSRVKRGGLELSRMNLTQT
jgi:hypothetical protein